jgi:hypothetical protein
MKFFIQKFMKITYFAYFFGTFENHFYSSGSYMAQILALDV